MTEQIAPNKGSQSQPIGEHEQSTLMAAQVIGIQEQAFSQKFWYVIRRWPILPMLVLFVMVISRRPCGPVGRVGMKACSMV